MADKKPTAKRKRTTSKKRTRPKVVEATAAKAEPQPAADTGATVEEPKATEEAPVRPVDVFDIMRFSLEQFAAVAWQKMGLHPDAFTGNIERDLAQAKVAIDLAARLAEALDPKLDDEDRRRVQALVSDLRINYVRQAQKTSEA